MGGITPLIAYCRAAAIWLPGGVHDPRLIHGYAQISNVLVTDETGMRASAFLTDPADASSRQYLLSLEAQAQAQAPHLAPPNPAAAVFPPPLPPGFWAVPQALTVMYSY